MAVIVGSLLICSEGANAQAVDSQFFRVTVNEAISLHSPGDVLISHDSTDDDQVFPEQAWSAFTTNTSGATVDFTIGKFIHERFGFFRRNAQINLRVVSSAGDSNWTPIISSDATTGYFFGQQTATVTAESFAPGEGMLGITVSFIEFNNRFLAAGRYNATVTGTISNK
jgi:hypothetical protein